MTKQILAFLFCFKRELNLYPHLRARTQTYTPPLPSPSPPRTNSNLYSPLTLNPSVFCTLKRASASFPVTTVERMDVEPNPKKTTLKIPPSKAF